MISATNQNLYIVATVGTLKFAVAAQDIRVIADFAAFVPVPGAPGAVIGIASKRSQIVTLIDSEQVIGNVQPNQSLLRNFIPLRAIVATINGFEYGFVVSAIDNSGAATGPIISAPADVASALREFVSGLVKIDDRHLPILDLRAMVFAVTRAAEPQHGHQNGHQYVSEHGPQNTDSLANF